jgi:general secretion pathway protein I
MTRAAGRQAGFTLLEVLVALAILSLAVVASMQAFAQGLRLLRLAGEHQQATLLADQKVREVVDLKEGREEGAEGPLRWERTTRSFETVDLASPDGPPRGRVYEIDVRVTWEPQRQVEIRTLRTATATITESIPSAPSGGGATLPLGRAGATTIGGPAKQ